MNSHLSSEQLERVLAGRPAPEVTQHLKKCARCGEDVATMRAMFVRLIAPPRTEPGRYGYEVLFTYPLENRPKSEPSSAP